jgi:hypothetical protein
MSQYILDQGRRYNPHGLAPHPYPQHQVGWPAQLLTPNAGTYVSPGSTLTHLGQDQPKTDTDKLIGAAILIACAFLLWKLITPGVGRNPGGKNNVATVFKGAGGWYYKLARKKARRRGPFHSRCSATEAAHRKGYSVVDEE